MVLDSFCIAALLLVLTIALGVLRQGWLARITLIVGTLAMLIGNASCLPDGSATGALWSLGDIAVTWQLQPAAAWLLFWGGLAALAAFLSPSRAKTPPSGWPVRPPPYWAASASPAYRRVSLF